MTIYMPLLNEGTDVWVQVEAEPMTDGTYRIVGATPDDQEWAFPTGSVVRCTQKTFCGGENGLVAVEIAN
ncbi:MAG: hypothetical protein K8S25_01665 [Alphaproteobacteria bacterium]|nr:hypothetical protein [Alphaproteobacteria bacterium]